MSGILSPSALHQSSRGFCGFTYAQSALGQGSFTSCLTSETNLGTARSCRCRSSRSLPATATTCLSCSKWPGLGPASHVILSRWRMCTPWLSQRWMPEDQRGMWNESLSQKFLFFCLYLVITCYYIQTKFLCTVLCMGVVLAVINFTPKILVRSNSLFFEVYHKNTTQLLTSLNYFLRKITVSVPRGWGRV